MIPAAVRRLGVYVEGRFARYESAFPSPFAVEAALQEHKPLVAADRVDAHIVSFVEQNTVGLGRVAAAAAADPRIVVAGGISAQRLPTHWGRNIVADSFFALAGWLVVAPIDEKSELRLGLKAPYRL